MNTDRITITGLTKYYGETLVLDDINLVIAPHEVVCLIGASGSGKSTLLRCINRLTEFDYGTIALDGISLDDPSWGRNGVYRKIGIVFQSYNLFPHMSVMENITLAPLKVHGISKPEALATARDLLTAFGMAEFENAYPEQLSGGQQQRVAIVRALATQPEVMLFDEVTAALDPELVGEVLAIIRKLKSDGMTMVIVTHEMGFARDVADRICFLDGGRIVEEAEPKALFSSPQNPRTRKFLQRIIEAGRL